MRDPSPLLCGSAGTWVSVSTQAAVTTSSPQSPLRSISPRNFIPMMFLPLLPTSKAVLMATGNSFFNHELAPPTATADGRVERYFVVESSSHGGAPAGVPDVGSLVAGIGMAPDSFVMPEGALAAAGYGAVGAIPIGVAVARQPRTGTNNGEAAPFKGAWTKEEDEILKEMVRAHGDRKWAVIAQNLPGRIGKQCRERWTNHLRPDIKKDIWTEEDDRALIEAHRSYGNCWSAIARCLPGRSENAVKNHWNATKRSLKSKRRLKKRKSEQAAPGQFSLLEEYIRLKCPTTEAIAPLPVSTPPSTSRRYGSLIGPTAVTQPASSSPPGMGMYLNTANSVGASHLWTMNLNMPPPPLPDLNAYGEPQEGYYPSSFAPDNMHYGVQVPALAQPQVINTQDLQAVYTSLNLYPFAENLACNVEFECQSSNQTNAGGYYHEAGPSSSGGSGDPDDIDVVQMASREFLTPSEDEVTLDLTRFK